MKLRSKSGRFGTRSHVSPSTDVQTAAASAPSRSVPTATKPGPPRTTLIICAPFISGPPTRRHATPSRDTQAAARTSSTEVRSLPTATRRPSLDATPAIEALANTSAPGTRVQSSPSVDTQIIAWSVPSNPTATKPGPPTVTDVIALPGGPGKVATRSKSIDCVGMLGVTPGGVDGGGLDPLASEPINTTMPRTAMRGVRTRRN
jgi:hypothetical protein